MSNGDDTPKVRIEDLFKPLTSDEPPVEDITMDEPLATRSIYPCERFDLKCADCGSPMRIRTSKKYNRPFYGCTRYPECDGTHGAHPDGRPLGIPATKEVKKARQKAHALFDKIWQENIMSRAQAYAWLRRKMKLSEGEGHISNFGKEQCEKLMGLVRESFPQFKTIWDRILEGPFDEFVEEVGEDDVPY